VYLIVEDIFSINFSHIICSFRRRLKPFCGRHSHFCHY